MTDHGLDLEEDWAVAVLNTTGRSQDPSSSSRGRDWAEYFSHGNDCLILKNELIITLIN